MVSVASLLNPAPSAFDDYRQPSSPCSAFYKSEADSPPPPPLKKQKMTKDAAVFAKGKLQGMNRYPPCEKQDEKTVAEHRRFQIYPMGKISEYRRHIPYNSEKKSFLEKTGRESFEGRKQFDAGRKAYDTDCLSVVYQYTFKVPGDERTYTVMWDYNVGLVRITPFFKCCQYAKVGFITQSTFGHEMTRLYQTMPAKMLNNNPGLREICHSITGGALAAQGKIACPPRFAMPSDYATIGYWMPFDAAKAVAATFCYNIRYALTPVFGLDFLSLCVKPGTEGFGHMVIDRSIVRKCTDEAKEYRSMSREGSRAGSPRTPASSTPSRWSAKSLRLKPTRTIDIESGYGTDTDRSDKYLHSPQSTFQWTALNTPRSTSSQQYTLPSPRKLLADAAVPGGCDAPPNSPEGSSSEESYPTKGALGDVDDSYHEKSLSPRSSEESLPARGPRRGAASTKETRAAYLLMQLHIADRTLKDGGGQSSKRRRASS